ncbi:MAG TPA: M20 family metallopeptidase [Gemmatimonadales bacterium]|nr:M20 family metallopeptidase [Gemmatimonadales bacterium]
MDAKTAIRRRVSAEREGLVALSHRIHADPELGWEEEHGSAWVAELLADAGFDVTPNACDLPTAFIARAGSGPLHVAICAEYDALPGVGHACGHNIIAAMSAGAGIAAAEVADEVGLTVSVIGTPAEEVGNASGKILMLERGAFDGVHAAMMVHPAPFDWVVPRLIAASMFEVRYTGKAAHASAFPDQGINAADALTIAQTAIGLLRQHIRQTDRIHGIVTKGGDAPNIVPAHTEGRYIIRSETVAELGELREKVYHCFEAGALATGSTLQVVGGDQPYTHMIHDGDIADLYRANALAAGRTLPDLGPLAARIAASTDMGNVSLAVPSIHPMIGIDSGTAGNHQPEFTAYCVKPAADKALVDGALAMAWTAVDLAEHDALRARLTTTEAS